MRKLLNCVNTAINTPGVRNMSARVLLGCSILVIILAFTYAAYEQQRMQEASARAAFWENVIDHTGRGVVVCDMQGRIMGWNNGAATIFGYTSTEMMGKRPTMIIADDTARKKHCVGFSDPAVVAKLQRGDIVMFHDYGLTKSGKRILVGIELAYIHDHYSCFMATIVPIEKERQLFDGVSTLKATAP